MSMRFFIILPIIAFSLINAAAESEPAGVTCREAAELIRQDLLAIRPQVPDSQNGELMLAYHASRSNRFGGIVDRLDKCEKVDSGYVAGLSRSINTIRGNMQSLESCIKTCPAKDRGFIQAQLKDLEGHISRLQRCSDMNREERLEFQRHYAANEAAARAKKEREAQVRRFIAQQRNSKKE